MADIVDEPSEVAGVDLLGLVRGQAPSRRLPQRAQVTCPSARMGGVSSGLGGPARARPGLVPNLVADVVGFAAGSAPPCGSRWPWPGDGSGLARRPLVRVGRDVGPDPGAVALVTRESSGVVPGVRVVTSPYGRHAAFALRVEEDPDDTGARRAAPTRREHEADVRAVQPLVSVVTPFHDGAEIPSRLRGERAVPDLRQLRVLADRQPQQGRRFEDRPRDGGT